MKKYAGGYRQLTSSWELSSRGFVEFVPDYRLSPRRKHKGTGMRQTRPRALRGVALTFDILEDRRLLAATTVEPVFHDMLSVAVLGQSLFYGNSSFDGNLPPANASDDAAIATDKTALLPGGLASFANYSSYSRGINGVMVDIAGLPSNALTAEDFDFRVGNSNGPSNWIAAPAPTSITVRLGAGVSGSARVEIVWADNAIQNEWLQVSVNATLATGLAVPDVFYFGNAIGETGNSTTDAIVSGADVTGVQNHFVNSAPITSSYDFNRDGMVDATDESIAVNNGTTASTALQLIIPSVPVQTPPNQREPIELFNGGDSGYPDSFFPNLVTTKAGTILAIAEGRTSPLDSSAYALVMRRSTDGGISWSPPTAIYGVTANSGTIIGSPSPVVDQTTGAIFVVFARNNTDILVTQSNDDGLTWSDPTDITSSVKVTAAGNPGPPGEYSNTPWNWYVPTGSGIQLAHGATAGRLLVPADHRETADNLGPSWANVVYSDDHGQSWHLGGGLLKNADGSPSPNDNSNESALVELADGSVYMSSRIQVPNTFYRGGSTSFDGGITWGTMSLTQIVSNRVEGSLLRLDSNTIVFASPSSSDGTRRDLTIWASYDNTLNWVKLKDVDFGPSGYSGMTLVGPDTLLLAYNHGFTGGALVGGGSNSGILASSGSKIGLLRINLRFLQSSDPYQFDWYFNEQPPGQPAVINSASIRDYGPWDSRAEIVDSGLDPAPKYVAGAAGDSALELVGDSNKVVLTPGGDNALQFDIHDSFTVEIVMKTTDTSGVIIGTRPTIKNWTLQIVGGKVQFSVSDLATTPTITTTAAINDGQWHRIEAVRDATSRLLKLFVDGVEAATPVADTATQARTAVEPIDPVTLGDYNTQGPSNPLAFDVDTVRVTRAALAPASFLPANFVNPIPFPAPVYPTNAPPSLPGLQLWLPPYDSSKYFSGFTSFSDPLPLTPFVGMASASMLDASSNDYQVSEDRPLQNIQYTHDPVIGSSWQLSAAPNAPLGSELQVHSSNGTGAKNFDFVQDTGVFTISTFVNVGADTGGPMTLFDTSEDTANDPGFSLFTGQDGSLHLEISGGLGQAARFNGSAPGAAVNQGQWFHVAVVGSGPGNPIVFYVTPLSATGVTAYSSIQLTGANGTFPTDSAHDLLIGGQSGTANGHSGASPFNGEMVNEAIFNQALTPAQIQQLFLSGKGLRAIDLTATEGQPFSGPVANYMVGNPLALASDYSAIVAWGDGQTTVGVVSMANGFLTVSGTNIYAAEGLYPVSVTIHGPNGSSAAVTSTATVLSALSAGGINVAAAKGLPFNSSVASFTDADPGSAGDYTAQITWGDGHTSAAAISLVDGVYVVTAPHTYAGSGSFPISVAINDVDGSSVTVGSTATVRNPISAIGINANPIKGYAFSGTVAAFTDVDANAPAGGMAATIDWGDGHTSPGTIAVSMGIYSVSGTNTYGVSGSYTIGVTINDADNNSLTAMAPAVVRNAVSANGINLISYTHVLFNGSVATFTDISPSGGAGATATITWGDGHISAGSISAVNGLFTVTGSNTYSAVGTYPISVSVNNAAGDSATATSTATVTNAINAHGINVNVIHGQAFTSAVASFTDVGPGAGAGAAATIVWGDGNTSAATISAANGVFTVTGAHTYATPGVYPIQVTISDADGSSGTANSSASVGVSGAVIGSQLFYHNSSRYDVTNATFPGFSDDNAIAIDKTAYLPGSGPATFSNISSYSKGINGIMVDILGSHPSINANDFIFKVGNNNVPNNWAAAPAPTAVTVRAGAGLSGSDRVELIWADNAIQKQWLEVTVLTTNTGLAANNVFFFGNAVANSGNADTATLSETNSVDELGARNNGKTLLNNIPITNIFDYNRDGLVNSVDQLLARNNTQTLGATRYINIAAAGPFAPLPPQGESSSDSGATGLASGNGTVASALAASTSGPTQSRPPIPAWMVNRLSHLDWNSGPVAKYFEQLAHQNTAKARAILIQADRAADVLNLDDTLLDSLLVNLGLD
jgi:hypothetical protein